MITNPHSGTRVDEVASGIYGICTPLDAIPGGFTFNSYLIADEQPLLFHTGFRKLFPFTAEAVAAVLPVAELRWIGGSHFESDEFGALNELLAAAPGATPFGAEIGVLTSLDGYGYRPARGLRDGEELSLGARKLTWLYTPHVPHGWDCGVLFDSSTGTLLCGDLFTQPGATAPPVTESEILTASESMRGDLDYAHAAGTPAVLSGSQTSVLRCSPASTGARIGATERRCCANWHTRLSAPRALPPRELHSSFAKIQAISA